MGSGFHRSCPQPRFSCTFARQHSFDYHLFFLSVFCAILTSNDRFMNSLDRGTERAPTPFMSCLMLVRIPAELKITNSQPPDSFLIALVEHRHIDRGIGATPSGITLRHPITTLLWCEPLCAITYNGQSAVLDVRIRRSTSIHGSQNPVQS